MFLACIAAYKNDPTAINLIKLLTHHYKCDSVVIQWQISGYWYIPAIHYLGETHTNQELGFSMLYEPSAANYAKLIQHADWHTPYVETIESESLADAKIILGWQSRVPDDYDQLDCKFAIRAFLDKLTSYDLLRRKKIKQEFMLNILSHAVRNPLNGILYMTKEISQLLTNNEAITYLNQSSIQLANNIFDIIDMNKLELGKLAINKEVLNIRTIISEVLDLIKGLSNSSISIVSHVEQNVPEYIYSDATRIKQILITLLKNALQHTQLGEISIYVTATIINLAAEEAERGTSLAESTTALECMQYNISFSVKDTGTGVDADYKPMLFKPIELITHNKSHGISLRTSYLLAKALNGNLQLKPTVSGSWFEFSLIACEEEPAEVSQATNILHNKSVLLITDSYSIRDMRKVFDKYQVKYTIASTQDELTILHKDKQFDLIIFQVANYDAWRDIVHKTPVLYITHPAQPAQPTHTAQHYSLPIPYDYKTVKSKIIEIFNNVDNSAVRLLIVEHEQINKIVINKILRSMGYIAITMAHDGNEALKLYNSNFDVVLINTRLPGMSSAELADKIHDINHNAKMCGITSQNISLADTRPWFNLFIYKPIDAAELQKMINSLR